MACKTSLFILRSYEPGEEGFDGLTARQLVKITFPENTEIAVPESYPERFNVEAEEIMAMSTGGFYLREDGADRVKCRKIFFYVVGYL